MRTLFTILLLLWFIIGYFWCKKSICNSPVIEQTTSLIPPVSTSSDCKASLVFKDVSTEFSIVSEENFKFNYSDYTVLEFSNELLEVVKSVASYLDENPRRLIQIKGYYVKDEVNESAFDDLGLARANVIKTMFLEQGVNPQQIKILGKPLTTNCFDDDVLLKGISVAMGGLK